jgi:2,5-diamino-6-(ribosylamino)-4(3H)-pyrimidinone 5'-phosphate reductase
MAPPVAPVRRLSPEPTAQLAAEDVYTNISFPTREARPYVLINMISSLDGKVAVSGKAGSLGGPVDRTVMRTLRAHADAVMVGAGTLRAEKLTLAVPEDRARARQARGLKPQPLAVVATATGDVPLEENLLGPSPDNLVIFASAETPQEHLCTLSSYASVEVVAEEKTTTPEMAGSSRTDRSASRLDLAQVLETLKKRHAVDVLLVEGGPALNHTLVSSDLADELFLTLAPKVLGGDARYATPTVLEGPPIGCQKAQPRLISIHFADNELFLRYTLRLPSQAS